MDTDQKSSWKKPVFGGIVGALLLFGAYLALLTWLNSWEHVWDQFWLLQPWMSLLIMGFGTQVGLFVYLRNCPKMAVATGTGTAAVVTSGSMSTGSMGACCLHHATDVLPLVGLSAAAVFLTKYQSFFLVLGVVSNLVGISYMMSTIQKHQLHGEGRTWKTLLKISWKKMLWAIAVLGSISLLIYGGILLGR